MTAVASVRQNARCLTEGVDVPAVDMVAFMSPKKSKVDIVQATGRAMRKSPDKTVGYVMVPLYIELASGEEIEDAFERTDFGEIWDVLQAMQERDEALVSQKRRVARRPYTSARAARVRMGASERASQG